MVLRSPKLGLRNQERKDFALHIDREGRDVAVKGMAIDTDGDVANLADLNARCSPNADPFLRKETMAEKEDDTRKGLEQARTLNGGDIKQAVVGRG